VLVADMPPQAIGTSIHIIPLPRSHFLISPLAKGAAQIRSVRLIIKPISTVIMIHYMHGVHR
jgi:hypothetical protein